MKVIKRYTAIQIGSQTINDTVSPVLSYGDIEGPYYSQKHPEQEFDTEDEAISYAYDKAKYSTWLIAPVVSFDNF